MLEKAIPYAELKVMTGMGQRRNPQATAGGLAGFWSKEE
jgi:hypothetical protein